LSTYSSGDVIGHPDCGMEDERKDREGEIKRVKEK